MTGQHFSGGNGPVDGRQHPRERPEIDPGEVFPQAAGQFVIDGAPHFRGVALSDQNQGTAGALEIGGSRLRNVRQAPESGYAEHGRDFQHQVFRPVGAGQAVFAGNKGHAGGAGEVHARIHGPVQGAQGFFVREGPDEVVDEHRFPRIGAGGDGVGGGLGGGPQAAVIGVNLIKHGV